MQCCAEGPAGGAPGPPGVSRTSFVFSPILVGGGGERRTFGDRGSLGDAWQTWATSSQFRRKSHVLDRHRAVAGRDPADIRRVCGAVVTIVPASRRPKAQADGTLAGTAGDLADALDEYRRRESRSSSSVTTPRSHQRRRMTSSFSFSRPLFGFARNSPADSRKAWLCQCGAIGRPDSALRLASALPPAATDSKSKS
jgi:hypothetical protein